MDYPAPLVPLREELLVLPLGTTVSIARSHLTFPAWPGRTLRGPGRKHVLDARGQPARVEEVILQLCATDGWNGVYLEEFGSRCFASSGDAAGLPAVHAETFSRICSHAVSRLGCFNVVLWKGSRAFYAFATCDMRSRLRTPQLRWIAAALEAGLPAKALLIIEWRSGQPES